MKVKYVDALLDAMSSGKEPTPKETEFLKQILPASHPINWRMVAWP